MEVRTFDSDPQCHPSRVILDLSFSHAVTASSVAAKLMPKRQSLGSSPAMIPLIIILYVTPPEIPTTATGGFSRAGGPLSAS